MIACRELRTTVAAIATVSSLSVWMTPAAAQSQFEQCNAVLQGDLMNKILSNVNVDSAARQVLRTKILKESFEEAFSDYNKEMDQAKSQGQRGKVGINYFGIGGDADFQIDYDNRISQSEFQRKFSLAKQKFQQSGEKIDESSTSFASSYASYVRDPNTIDAWKACVTQKAEMGLFAFASRDDSDEPSVNVVYGPGLTASTFPSLTIDNISLPDGATISDTTKEIGVGSGHTYRVSFPNHKRGFTVIVNGSLKDRDGRTIHSFTAQPQIPPVRDPQATPPTGTMPGPTTGPVSDCTFGKNTCKQGSVWRVANPTDLVCASVAARDRVARENAEAPSHQHRRLFPRPPRMVCNNGFVRRAAFAGDTVCVTPFARQLALRENRFGRFRIACLQQ
jgi:hypothetical protein